MSFEDKGVSFIKAILANNHIKAESILCECDDRKMILISALNEVGKEKIESIIKLFKSIGLRRVFSELMENYSKLNKKQYITKTNLNKIVYTNHKNRLNNEKYHLTGSSFANERKSIISA